MRPKYLVILLVTVLMTAAVPGPAAARVVDRSASASIQKSHDISGDWKVSFQLEGYPATPATFNLKVDGDRVTGNINSDHTGPGTVRDGRWVDGELSFTADFAAHESIAITGRLKDGKLVGEFATEGMKGTWQASKQ